MPLIKLLLKPGINKDLTDYSGEGGWVDSEKVRFRAGFPQKIGGWEKHTADLQYGVCRSIFNYTTTYQDNIITLGTNEKAYLNIGNRNFDITPVRTTFTSTATDNCFDTTDGSSDVTVNLTAHGAADGDWVTFSGATAVGGITADELNTEFKITLIDSNSFTITTTGTATSSATGGGTSIEAEFQISIGNTITVFGYGWGTDAWSSGAWGESSTQPVIFVQRDWFFTNLDNDLYLNIREGTPYVWQRGTTVDPTTAIQTRAISLADSIPAEGTYTSTAAPVKVGQLFVSQQDRHLIAFGAVPFGSVDENDYDPLLIRWADQDTPTQWTPAQTNSAGDIRVSRGSKIVCAYPTRQEILVFTDSNLYTLQFLGTNEVFGVQEYSERISIVGPRAVATADDIVYWMGFDKFYLYDGRIRTLPCSLREHVYANFNPLQSEQVTCGTNDEWSEIWWFYPSKESNWNDLYVVYNYQEKIWYHGNLGRTAWLESSLQDYPLAAFSAESANPTGYLYEHEKGLDADGEAMVAYIESNDFDLADGDQYALTKRIIPDMRFTNSTADTPEATMSILKRNFPGQAQSEESEDSRVISESSVGVFTDQVFIRARARQMALKIQSTDAGVMWRLGSPRVDVKPDGRR